MIESGSLEEKEYVEQHDKYFHDIALSSTARRKISLNLQCTGQYRGNYNKSESCWRKKLVLLVGR